MVDRNEISTETFMRTPLRVRIRFRISVMMSETVLRFYCYLLGEREFGTNAKNCGGRQMKWLEIIKTRFAGVSMQGFSLHSKFKYNKHEKIKCASRMEHGTIRSLQLPIGFRMNGSIEISFLISIITICHFSHRSCNNTL